MFTDEAGGTRPVGRDRRGFLKELGLGGIARERRLSCRRLGTATFLSPAGSGDFLVAGWERRLSCRRLGAAAFLPPAGSGGFLAAGLRGRSGQSPLLSRTFLPFRL